MVIKEKSGALSDLMAQPLFKIDKPCPIPAQGHHQHGDVGGPLLRQRGLHPDHPHQLHLRPRQRQERRRTLSLGQNHHRPPLRVGRRRLRVGQGEVPIEIHQSSYSVTHQVVQNLPVT